MSDKRRVTFDEMNFYYEIAIRHALDNLFKNVEEHGWTEKEYNDASLKNIQERITNELQGYRQEDVLH